MFTAFYFLPSTGCEKGSKQKTDQVDEEEDDYFDPTANPFDPNQRRNRNRTPGSY